LDRFPLIFGKKLLTLRMITKRILLALVLLCPALHAQFRKIDMRHGLSFNSVMCIKETSDGLLWVGTREGLNVYDGYEFKVFKHSPKNVYDLSNNHVNVIFEDAEHHLWIGTSNGLNRYEGGTFKHWTTGNSALSNAYVKSISQAAAGNLWIGTSNGLNLLDTNTGKISTYRLENADANNIISLYTDTKGTLWLGTKGGLYTYKNHIFHRIPILPPLEIRDIEEDAQGRMWLATETQGIYCLHQGKIIYHWTKENSPALSNQVRKLRVEDDRVLAATLSGMYMVSLPDLHFSKFIYSINDPDGLSRGSIHDIQRDRFGGYWIATYSGGLNYYHAQNNLFTHHRQLPGKENGLSENDVNGFVEDAQERIWVSTGRGLNRFDPRNGQFEHFTEESPRGLSNRIIKSMTKDRQGNLWIGTYKGLNFLDTRTLRFQHYLQNPSGLNQNQIHALYCDADNQLWIGMNGGELQVLDIPTRKFTTVPGVGSIVSAIYEDRKGKLWIGTRSGLKCLDRKSRKPIDLTALIRGYENELLYINQILEDGKGRLWLATQGSGLFVLEKDSLHWFGQGKGLNGNTVNAVLGDEQGYMWISTNAGISRLDYKQGQLNSIDYSEVHGLQGLQFNPGSALRAGNGILYFGGINGFNAFLPASMDKTLYFPEVRVTQVRPTSGKTPGKVLIPGKEPIVLTFEQRDVAVDFAGLNFVNPQGIYYRYRLEGLNADWVATGKLRSVNFTYLPVGTHTLQLQASSQPGSWGKEYTTLAIKILPPWYRTTLAYVLYFVAALAACYGLIHYLKQRNAKRIKGLLREKEQKMLARRLEFFTDISHELRTPLTLILTPLERILWKEDLPENVSKQLHLIQRNGRKMMNMISQVLNLRRFEESHSELLELKKEQVDVFLTELALSFRPLAVTKNLAFTHLFSPIQAYIDAPKVEMVVQNLLSNAFKFTPENGQIHLSAARMQGEFYVKIENTGQRIEHLEHIFERYQTQRTPENPEGAGIGLDLVKRMVELHQGRISVEQLPEENHFRTIFTLHLPLLTAEVDAEETHLPEVALVDSLPAAALPESSEKQVLLLVEDNAEVRQMIKDILAAHYLIHEAEDGAEGWIQAQKIHPDLIISDIMMPVVDGIELCRRLKTDLKTSHIPVILLTARATITFKHEGYETGADAYITKPFSPQHLLVRIKNLLHQRQTLRLHLQRETLLAPGDAQVNSIDAKLLTKARAYVEVHLADSKFTLEDMSRELGLSRMHLHRKLKALTGLTPAEFVKNVRLQKAAAMLKQNNVSVKEVMNLVGFEDADHFRNSFKDLFGQLPSAFKQA
jgi:ligand-binding sensor domain-containing protein/signal transduction histidine kinase/DNA-binding response OmpR family regulator